MHEMQALVVERTQLMEELKSSQEEVTRLQGAVQKEEDAHGATRQEVEDCKASVTVQ